MPGLDTLLLQSFAGSHRGQPLIVALHRQSQVPFQVGNELIHHLGLPALLTAHGQGITYHGQLDFLLADHGFELVPPTVSRIPDQGYKRLGDYLQWIGNRQPHPPFTEVDP